MKISILAVVAYCGVATSLLVATAACSQTAKTVTPADLTLTYASGPTLERSDELDVFITNMSGGCVQFPDDFGIRIFYERAGQWVETGNLMSYAPGQDNHVAPRGDPFQTTSVSLIPDLRHVEIKGVLRMKATIEGSICGTPSAKIEKEIPFAVAP